MRKDNLTGFMVRQLTETHQQLQERIMGRFHLGQGNVSINTDLLCLSAIQCRTRRDYSQDVGDNIFTYYSAPHSTSPFTSSSSFSV